tara:strand:+ start:59 stop:667 length:609 start_codon:yes stop_codon:yes gene_type:complete
MKIQVFDDLLPNTYADYLEHLHFRSVPWYFSSASVDYKNIQKFECVSKDLTYGVSNNKKNHIFTPNTVESLNLFHFSFLDGMMNSDFFDKISEVLKYIPYNVLKIDTIRHNLTFNHRGTGSPNYQTIHKDHDDENMYSLLYYVNDSDGDTLFFEENGKEKNRVSPKRNRATLYKSSEFHAASNPVEHTTRIVINFKFFMEKI